MSYGELVLVCGDAHIPHRAAEINEQFRTILVPNKMQHVLCTGNLTTKDQLEYLRSLAPKVHVARGDFDEDDTLPETKVVTIGGFRIGLCHGHQIAPSGEVEALSVLQRSLDVDVLVTGNTHHTSVAEFDGRCYVNPGSITGAYTPLSKAPVAPAAAPDNTEARVLPSFMLMNITESRCIDFFLYELTPSDVEGVPGKLRISKSNFSKPRTGAPAAGAAP